MLDLNELRKGAMPAITSAVGAALAEAGGVCLESQGHEQGVALTVRGYHNNCYAMVWPCITEQSRLAWNDPENATEHGAVGIAVLVAKKITGYEIIRQSWKGTGFDYWMGKATDEGFANKAGLEISGIRKGDDRTIKNRIRQKIQQTDRTEDSDLQIYVIVVEFGTPVAEVKKK